MNDPEPNEVAEVEQNWLFLTVKLWTFNAVCSVVVAALALIACLRQLDRPGGPGAPPLVLWFGILTAVSILTAVLSVVASKSIRHRRRWMVIVLIALYCCLQPGVSLLVGATTLVLLFRPSVRALFS